MAQPWQLPAQVANEFCRWRNLRPIRILLGGPPAAGKTLCSAELAAYYGILHIKLDEVRAEGWVHIDQQDSWQWLCLPGEELEEMRQKNWAWLMSLIYKINCCLVLWSLLINYHKKT